MLEALTERTVIIGNSGSGKSVFAERLAALNHVPVIDLDLLHWLDDGYRIRREEEVAKCLVRDAAAAPRWIIEGVYGWLAEIALPRASALVWLDLPWSVGRESLILTRSATGRETSRLRGPSELRRGLLGSTDILFLREPFAPLRGFRRNEVETAQS
jgi:hypothetical protein